LAPHAVKQDVSKADEKLVKLMQQDAVVRKVALTYVLQRVTVGDLASAEPLLLAAKEVRAARAALAASSQRRGDVLGLTNACLAAVQALSDVLWLDEGGVNCTKFVPLPCRCVCSVHSRARVVRTQARSPRRLRASWRR
jgi:hypothetical protein